MTHYIISIFKKCMPELKNRYVCLNFDFRLRLLNVHMSNKFIHCKKKKYLPQFIEKIILTRNEPNIFVGKSFVLQS